MTDFDFANGDAIVVAAGVQYDFAQVGADTVVTLADGSQVILQGVRLSSLGVGWIVEG